MKCIIYVENGNVAEQIKYVIKQMLPSSKVDIVNNCMECFNKGVSYDYAFISDNNEGMPWMNLMFHLSARGVGVYFISEEIDKELLKSIKEASGLSAINSSNIEQEIKAMFAGMEDQDSSQSKDTAKDEEKENNDLSATISSIQDYVALKSRKYPAVIVSIHGAKGGVGKTSVAVNTAVMLSKMGYKVGAVDFDIENGNFLNVLHLTTEKDLKDAIKGNFQYTQDSFEIHSSGLYVLPSLKLTVEAEIITAEVAERIIGRMARMFDVIIIDTGSLEIDPMLVSLQVSTKSYFITTFDMTVVGKTYDLLEDARIMGVDTSKIKLLINRKPKKVSIKSSDISHYISVPILTEIPEDEGILNVVNSGKVPVETKECESYKKGITVLINDIIKETKLVNKLAEQKNDDNAKKEGGKLKK